MKKSGRGKWFGAVALMLAATMVSGYLLAVPARTLEGEKKETPAAVDGETVPIPADTTLFEPMCDPMDETYETEPPLPPSTQPDPPQEAASAEPVPPASEGDATADPEPNQSESPPPSMESSANAQATNEATPASDEPALEEPLTPPETDEVTVYGEMADDAAWEAWAEAGYPWPDDGAESAIPSLLALETTDISLPSAQNSEQIVEPGGRNENAEDGVSVSKILKGTDLENVFDITLEVTTTTDIASLFSDPDMAVVLVMDISRTMKDPLGDETRYLAAVSAAQQFITMFSQNTGNRSRLGSVAFHTNSNLIFEMQPCCDSQTAQTLKTTIAESTKALIEPLGADSDNRFTNMEGGIKRAADMLDQCDNAHKFIVFLSDGFPTTYDKTDYIGYPPFSTKVDTDVTADGVFYDAVVNKYCDCGTSYSDRAAQKAQAAATAAKGKGIEIYTVGVAVDGQSVAKYVNQTVNDSFSVVDRAGTDYVINNENGEEDFEGWLESGIGSGEGHYFSIDNVQGLLNAYQTIFAQIRDSAGAASKAVWVTQDPIPSVAGTKYVEFIGFFDKNGTLTQENLTEVTGNTATFDWENNTIAWDLKQSACRIAQEDGKTQYHYQMVYRVRLKNENGGFEESTEYATNDVTLLTYRVITTKDGQPTVSGDKSLAFPIPAVKGFLAEFSYQKQDQNQEPVKGAVFTLSHDTANCGGCHGDETSVDLPLYTATSDSEGWVCFEGIPSGHRYTLTETTVPGGYTQESADQYRVCVAYDNVSVTILHFDAEGNASEEILEKPEDLVVTNTRQPLLPDTGGIGVLAPTCLGSVLMLGGGATLLWRRGKERRRKRS